MDEAPRISVHEAKKVFDRGSGVFVDTRNPQAWAESEVKLPVATRVTADRVNESLDQLPKDRLLITYCS